MISLYTSDWSIKGIKTVLFDKDGTFVDLHYFWGKMTELRSLEIIKEFNLNESHLKKLCFFLGYDVASKKMIPDGITALYSRSKIIEIFVERLKEFGVITTIEKIEKIFDKVSEKFYQDIKNYIKPIPEAIEFIKLLHDKDVKIGVVTSDSVKSTDLTLKLFGWENYFDVIIGRESSDYAKESGEPTKLALKLLGARPDETIMIGDAQTDYFSAKNAGIDKTILVTTGQVGKDELKKYSKFVLDNLSEINVEEVL